MNTITTIGLDIAKSVFQVHGTDAAGKPVVRKQLKRRQVLSFFKNIEPCLVGIEACASSHHWARELIALGHDVRLMPPAYVKTGWNAVAIDPGKLDRSPCGTGCSARMAVLHARGELAEGEAFVGRSIIDSRFDCRIAGLADVGGRPAIVPRIAGRGFITGTHQLMLDPADPWPGGYRLSDTWPVRRV